MKIQIKIVLCLVCLCINGQPIDEYYRIDLLANETQIVAPTTPTLYVYDVNYKRFRVKLLQKGGVDKLLFTDRELKVDPNDELFDKCSTQGLFCANAYNTLNQDINNHPVYFDVGACIKHLYLYVKPFPMSAAQLTLDTEYIESPPCDYMQETDYVVCGSMNDEACKESESNIFEDY
eukprot:TRINITY_DN3349_c0_g1_i1.p1 TRINITY_DN3349_c0_g1~~TRINITY_DN3349_c0_g1_i1.p1  ORF type:complete len:177 (+),score=19.31 TRINITY_DN3349_c0_g1_i1:51-581(+)